MNFIHSSELKLSLGQKKAKIEESSSRGKSTKNFSQKIKMKLAKQITSFHSGMAKIPSFVLPVLQIHLLKHEVF